MYPWELFPEYLFTDRELLTVYAFCMSLIRPHPGKASVNGEVFDLRPQEILIPKKELERRLCLETESAEPLLRKLEKLNLIGLRCLGDRFAVDFPHVTIPHRSQEMSVDGPEGEDQTITVSEFGERYIQHAESTLAPKSVENGKRVYKHFNKRYGAKRLVKLRPRDVQDFVDDRARTGASATTVNMDLRTLRASFQRALIWGYLRENPATNITQIRQEKSLPEILTKETLEEVLAVTGEQKLKEVFAFAFLTGMRRGEILNLTWMDINFTDKTIDVQSSESYRVKHGKARVLPMNSGAESILRGIEPKLGPFVFCNDRGEKLREDFVTKSFKKSIRELGLNEGLKFHSLRASFASELAGQGATALQIKDLLGHTYVKTTESYVRIPTSDLRGAMEKLTAPPL